MGKIKEIHAKTANPHVNLYELKAINKNGRDFRYYVASRAKSKETLKLNTHKNPPDGVVIFSVVRGNTDRVVLIRQYRYALDDYIYEFPAGLVDEGEDYHTAAVRELKEETGLKLEPITSAGDFERPFFTTIGMTDESCATVYGYAQGEASGRYLEPNEEIEVVLADRTEVLRILKEENVAIMCAYQLMHFLHDEEPFGFLG
ncbi:NUDIX hydrolase [Ruminococcus sp. OA3]|uniref:NUDIX hydrolase n=1 Tax=Ruminococcus sp. OA3 TaxID=2914164 RepID=UPI001F06D1FA|nr:NUDIX hydrolase [Ruminococcus sp. OA3]MCH1981026.1 NUDIX hydrolase [Ruminococcus sp. OA3]